MGLMLLIISVSMRLEHIDLIRLIADPDRDGFMLS